MQSKTSCFNFSVFKKNLTRFAPIWGLYTLCLTLGMTMTYQAGGTEKQFHFVENLAGLMQIMSIVNLVYAPLVAQMLFGDLYSSRMCNALHAMPLRREGLLVTNVLSGLLFSLIPTLVMTLVALPMTADSYFAEGWKMPFYLFAASNLYFLCFFGMAVFATFCAGNRLGMALLYALMNFGFFLVTCLVEAIYIPMLFGVVMGNDLTRALTPAWYFSENLLVEPNRIYEMTRLFGENRANWAPTYQLTDSWWNLLVWAGVGVILTVLSLPLYRKRDLECAGDTLAFRGLEPVFQILSALLGACALLIATEFILSGTSVNLYFFLFVGLAVGWFAGQMLIERSIQVFRLRNWLKCAVLAAVLALSLVLTYFDVLGIETWAPKPEDIQSIRFDVGKPLELTEEEDIRRILELQQEALRDRLDNSGTFEKTMDGSYVPAEIHDEALYAAVSGNYRYAYTVWLDFQLKSGRTVSRRYSLWADGESGDTARQLLSSWQKCISVDYAGTYQLDAILEDPACLNVEGNDRYIKNPDRELVTGLLRAVRKDCTENTMAQNPYLHQGYFRKITPDEEGNHYREKSLYLGLDAGDGEHYWSISIYPDCAHTLAFLQENDLLQFTVEPENIVY